MSFGLPFAVIVAFIGHFAWILSNCSSLNAGGDTCLIAKGLAPYIDGLVFLVAWVVGFVIQNALPEKVLDRIKRWTEPRK